MLVRLPWGLRRTGAHLTQVSPAPNISHQPQGEKNNAAKASLPTPTQGRPGSAQPQMETCMCARNCTERAKRETGFAYCAACPACAAMPPVMNGSLEGSEELCKGPVCPLPFLRWGTCTKCPSTRWPSTDVLKKVSGFLRLYVALLILLVLVMQMNSFLRFRWMDVSLCNSQVEVKNVLQGVWPFLL